MNEWTFWCPKTAGNTSFVKRSVCATKKASPVWLGGECEVSFDA